MCNLCVYTLSNKLRTLIQYLFERTQQIFHVQCLWFWDFKCQWWVIGFESQSVEVGGDECCGIWWLMVLSHFEAPCWMNVWLKVLQSHFSLVWRRWEVLSMIAFSFSLSLPLHFLVLPLPLHHTTAVEITLVDTAWCTHWRPWASSERPSRSDLYCKGPLLCLICPVVESHH